MAAAREEARLLEKRLVREQEEGSKKLQEVEVRLVRCGGVRGVFGWLCVSRKWGPGAWGVGGGKGRGSCMGWHLKTELSGSCDGVGSLGGKLCSEWERRCDWRRFGGLSNVKVVCGWVVTAM